MDSKTIPQLAHKQQLSPVFFTAFTAATEEPAKIGEAVGTGDYPGLDAAWHLYTSPSHPNAAKLSALEKSNVEQLCITSRHQCATGQTLEELLEQLQAVASDEDKRADTKAAASSIVSALQHLYIATEHTNNMLGDLGQKWQHTPDQGELAAYQIAAHKSACSKLVPKAVVHPKTVWCAVSSVARANPKRQQPPQQMAAAAPARSNAGRGSGGGQRPPATAPVAAVAVLP
jgi:hypothetical protein